MVHFLIKAGASPCTKAHTSQPSRESETPLLLSGRAGHMKIFQLLINAGAPVNIRSGEDGETPLISAARWDFFAGVQLLIAHGGCLRNYEVAEDEYPLIPDTLKTMRGFCCTTFEFEPMCSRVLIRLEEFCLKLQESVAMRAEEGRLVSFASILFRFCRLLFDIKKRLSPLSRFIGSRVITNKIQDFHEELDHFVRMLALGDNEHHWKEQWKEQWKDDQSLLAVRLLKKLSSDESLVDRLDDVNATQESTVLLLHELTVCHRERQRPELEANLERVLERFLRVWEVEAPGVPDWFISRDDVEFHNWNIIGANSSGITTYEGRWRKTGVTLETSSLALDDFSKTTSQWFQLSHPNVVKLFGACHVGSQRFFVYESASDGKQLNDFLGVESNRQLTWKCLSEAALGLQYIHSRGIVHGDLRGENIICDTDFATKLNGPQKTLLSSKKRNGLRWSAPELIQSKTPESFTSDIYAFGMCILAALTLELPRGDTSDETIREFDKEGKLPKRPANVSDAQWNLITKMCASDPNERVKISYVVNRLKFFEVDHEQNDHLIQASRATSGASEVENLGEHCFAELDGNSIPRALQQILSRCEQLPSDHWMTKKVCPAFEFIFAEFQQQQKSPADAEVRMYCSALLRFRRYLRSAVSEKSVYQLARSLQVAESHNMVYAELDRLLEMLGVSEIHPIRTWSRRDSIELSAPQYEDDFGINTSNPEFKTGSGSVTLNHCDTPLASHARWTQQGLAAEKTRPSWYISLRDVMFSDSDEIGQGAFALVYKGNWLGAPVVVKFLGYEEDYDTISTDLLLHEVRVWRRLSHPRILKFYGACHIDKRYIVCEHAFELHNFLKIPGNGRLTWQKMYEAALGLQYMHWQNITQNDLKCGNIMIGIEGKAKLIDFGLSCILNIAEIQINVKHTSAVNWRSPEYLAGERPSFASDVYSFAMCIIEAVNGDIPWGHPMMTAQIRYQFKRGNIPDLPVSMNEKQRNLIRLMTKLNPSERVRMSFEVDMLNEIVQEEIALFANAK